MENMTINLPYFSPDRMIDLKHWAGRPQKAYSQFHMSAQTMG